MPTEQPENVPAHRVAARPSDPVLGRSLALVRYLRRHCEWDAAQTAETLRPYLLEEAHEVSDAIIAGDDSRLASELGDLLLNVVFQIVVAEERGAFGAEDVVRGLEAKMRDRHPHVYGDAEEAPDWEARKAEERAARRSRGTREGEEAASEEAEAGEVDSFAGLPAGLEPLGRALRVQQRAAAEGFDWPDAAGPLAKVKEEMGELEGALEPVEERSGPASGTSRAGVELGDLLFAAVNLARHLGLHPSTALAGASRKFERRYAALLRLAAERGLETRSATLAELDALWDEAKSGADG